MHINRWVNIQKGRNLSALFDILNILSDLNELCSLLFPEISK